MGLNAEELATLTALQRKQSEPDDDTDTPAEVAGETAAEVGAAVAPAMATVAAAVAEVVGEAVSDAHRDETARLEHLANVAALETAAAEIRADEAELNVQALASVLDEVIAEDIAEDTSEPEVVVEEGAAAIVIDAAPGADVDVHDSPPEAGGHPYFDKRIRMPWQRA